MTLSLELNKTYEWGKDPYSLQYGETVLEQMVSHMIRGLFFLLGTEAGKK